MRNFLLVLALIVFVSNNAYAYWVWTPETKKWVNPKHASKDIPKDQFNYAMVFFRQKQYKKAIKEFRKLLNDYPRSIYAAESQYYLGECFGALNQYYRAYLEYQKMIDVYPGNNRIMDVLEKQMQIGNYFFYKEAWSFAGVRFPKDYECCIKYNIPVDEVKNTERLSKKTENIQNQIVDYKNKVLKLETDLKGTLKDKI